MYESIPACVGFLSVTKRKTCLPLRTLFRSRRRTSLSANPVPPGSFDYKFNLSYGRAITDQHPVLRQTRAMLDTHTRERIDADRN